MTEPSTPSAKKSKFSYSSFTFNLPFGGHGGIVQLMEALPNGESREAGAMNMTQIGKCSHDCQEVIDDFILQNPMQI